MSGWLEMEAELGMAILDTFREPIVLHLEQGDRSVEGVFELADDISEVRGGGLIRDSEAVLQLSNEDAMSVSSRSTLTARGRKWIVVQPPVSDGVSLTKFMLGACDAIQSGTPDIRY